MSNIVIFTIKITVLGLVFCFSTETEESHKINPTYIIALVDEDYEKQNWQKWLSGSVAHTLQLIIRIIQTVKNNIIIIFQKEEGFAPTETVL